MMSAALGSILNCIKALCAVAAPGAFADDLARVDDDRMKRRQARLDAAKRATAGESPHEGNRRMVIERGRLLRRRLLETAGIIGSAVVLAWLVGTLARTCGAALWPTASRDLTISSIAAFVFGTLARLGWAGQSFSGETIMERTDGALFQGFYWIGTFLGALALMTG